MKKPSPFAFLSALAMTGSLLVPALSSQAATAGFASATTDPASAPQWKIEKTGNAGTELRPLLDGDAGVWKIWTGDQASTITQTHLFQGGALVKDETVSLDYAHDINIAKGHRVGLRLLSAGNVPEVEFSFLGGGDGFTRKDAGTDFTDTGKRYDPNHLFNVAFTITGPTTYSAVADGHAWTGTFKNPIVGVQVFNEGGGDHSDQFSDNLIIQKPGAFELAAQPSQTAPAPLPAFMTSKTIDARVASLLKQMTLAEKLGQLTQYPNGFATGPDSVRVDQMEYAGRGGIGSILNMTGARAINAIQRQAVEKSRLKIPLVFGMDIIHGYRTVYPVPLAMASTWDPQITQQCARMAAVEGSSEGIRWTFSPMVDIARDARWGRITEGNGEDPYLGELMAAAWVRGYQGSDLTDPTTLVACAKHFVAYGAAEGGRDYNTVDISERSLRDVYLPPFQAAVDAGAGTFMSAFNTVDGVPASANHHTLTDILRGEWGFRGFVVSDWNSVAELQNHGIALDGADAARKAITSGVDMDMGSNLYQTKLPDLVKSGQVKIADIDTAVSRVLRIKFALGLFEHPYADETLAPKVLLQPQHLATAKKAAQESFVLLKNAPVGDKPLLPLADGQSVALIGPLADARDDMLGAWSGWGNGNDVVSLHQSLADRLKDKLLYAKGADIEGNSDAGFAEAVATAQKADVVVMALGERRGMSGEAASRTDLGLPGRQLDLLKAVVATGKPVVLVVFSGRPLTLTWEAGHVPSILEAWFPGVQAGPALVSTLYGESSPSGRLTASFPRSVGQMPLYYNAFSTGRPSKAPDQVGDGYTSAYMDEANSPLFPFGWGLSYTSFDYAPTRILTPKISVADLKKKGSISVEALVMNSGARAGTETVQLYIRERGTSVARPVRELKGFQQVQLAAGEARRVRFTLTEKELSFWGIDMTKGVEPCELTVWIAPNAEAGQGAKLMITPQ